MRERFIARDLKFREMACDSRKKTLQQVTSISHLLQILRILSFKQKIKNKSNLTKEEEFRETRVTFLMQYIIILEKHQSQKTPMRLLSEPGPLSETGSWGKHKI